MVLAVVLIVADRRFHHMESVRSVLSTLTYPLVYLAGAPARSMEWLADAFLSRERLQEHYEQLHLENLTLRGRLQRLEALEAENMRLRNLLEGRLVAGHLDLGRGVGCVEAGLRLEGLVIELSAPIVVLPSLVHVFLDQIPIRLGSGQVIYLAEQPDLQGIESAQLAFMYPFQHPVLYPAQVF